MYASPYAFVPNVLPPFREVPLHGPDALANPHAGAPPVGAHHVPYVHGVQQHQRQNVDLSAQRHKVSIPSGGAALPTHGFPSMHLPAAWAPQYYHPPGVAIPNIAASPAGTAGSDSSHTWTPCADVRETSRAYFIELEVPGLSSEDSDSVSVNWMSSRTVLVSGTVARPTLTTDDDEDGGQLKRTPTHEDAPDEAENTKKTEEPVLLFSERAIGSWRRSFVLPADANLGIDPNTSVSGDPLKYTVENGLVTVIVPKVK